MPHYTKWIYGNKKSLRVRRNVLTLLIKDRHKLYVHNICAGWAGVNQISQIFEQMIGTECPRDFSRIVTFFCPSANCRLFYIGYSSIRSAYHYRSLRNSEGQIVWNNSAAASPSSSANRADHTRLSHVCCPRSDSCLSPTCQTPQPALPPMSFICKTMSLRYIHSLIARCAWTLETESVNTFPKVCVRILSWISTFQKNDSGNHDCVMNTFSAHKLPNKAPDLDRQRI